MGTIMVLIIIFITIYQIFKIDKIPERTLEKTRSIVVANVKNDPALYSIIVFIDAFKKYEEFRKNTDLEPNSSKIWYTVNETGNHLSIEGIKSSEEDIYLEILVYNQWACIRFSLAGHLNIFNTFCEAIGKSTYFELENAGILLGSFDDNLKKFWNDAMVRDYAIDSGDGEITTIVNFLEKSIKLQFKDCENRYADCIRNILSEEYPNIKYSIKSPQKCYEN